MMRSVRRWLVVLAVVLVTVLAVRIYDSERGPALEPWHTYVPRELSRTELDRGDWATYVAAEARIFEALRTDVTQKLDEADRIPINRYFDGSPVYPGRFGRDWNRSFVLEPAGAPAGAVVLLHGLTDAPYSVRHIAERYRAQGYLAIAIRLPAHGTVPAALTDVAWEDWLAATRLAVREALRRVGPSKPLHLVGYSNGGALALTYALDALGDPALRRPDRLVLISPMIGVTGFARFAWLADLPAIFPAFAKAAWLSVLPEFNPFKYNSFPVNGARQSHRLTAALQQAVLRGAEAGTLGRLPPILTFQSVIDSTVSTSAIVSALYARLPANGSELVLFDLNRAAKLGLLFRPATETVLSRLLPNAPRPFRTTIIANADPETGAMEARTTEAGAVTEQVHGLGLSYPPDAYSLSHIALPFPTNDALYGSHPDGSETFGVNLGSFAARGESGALVINLDSLLRMTSNPFFPYLMARIDEGITTGAGEALRRP